MYDTIAAIWRIESPKLIGALLRIVRDLSQAEDLAQDALVSALEQWPLDGLPDNPGAWLMQAAKFRAIDHLRRRLMITEKHQEVAYALTGAQNAAPDFDAVLDDDVKDDLLRLMFTACDPRLKSDARAALTLRLIGGLTTAEIARAFLTSESTIAQRIVRAKKAIADAGVPFELPRGAERSARVSSVLEVIYLIFNEGYTATSGGDWMRPQLCEDALRVGRVLAALVPNEAEAHGLVALMEIQFSRRHARTERDGTPITLLEQDRNRWDRSLIHHGLRALERAFELVGNAPGPYALQGAIAACHAQAPTASDTDWRAIVTLYTALYSVTPSPVVLLNRAVAVGMAEGPEAGLTALEPLAHDPSLSSYHLLPSVRADLLARAGRGGEARAEFLRAAAMTTNAQERVLLERRAAAF